MKLHFKVNLSDDLENALAAGRYASFWQQNDPAITASFYRHTGLRFKQRYITVKIRSDGRSKAGNEHQPMELSKTWNTPKEVGCTLIHELAHRLIIGNGIELPENGPHSYNHYNYYAHRHIYLFLYDVYVDTIGHEYADREVARESSGNNAYSKAWQWALSMNYTKRQAVFKKLKQRYKLSIA